MRCYCREVENTVQCVQPLSALEAPQGLSGCCNRMTQDSDLMRFHSGGHTATGWCDAKGLTWASLFCAGIGYIFTLSMAQHGHVLPFAPLFALGGMWVQIIKLKWRSRMMLCRKSHTEVMMLILLMSEHSWTTMEERITICNVRAHRLHVPRVDIQMKPLQASCSSGTGP